MQSFRQMKAQGFHYNVYHCILFFSTMLAFKVLWILNCKANSFNSHNRLAVP